MARWILFVLMVLFVVQICAGFYLAKHGNALSGLRTAIGGCFFFLITYAAHWLVKN